MRHNKLWLSLSLPILASGAILPIALFTTSCSSVNSLTHGKVSVETKTIISNADIKTYCDNTSNIKTISSSYTYDKIQAQDKAFLTQILYQIKAIPGCGNLKSDDIDYFTLLPDTGTYTNIGNWITSKLRYHIILELKNDSEFSSDQVDPIRYSATSQIQPKFILDIPVFWNVSDAPYAAGTHSSHFPSTRNSTYFFTYPTDASVYSGQTYPVHDRIAFTNSKRVDISFIADTTTGGSNVYTEGYVTNQFTVDTTYIPSYQSLSYFSTPGTLIDNSLEFTARNNVQTVEYKLPTEITNWSIGFNSASHGNITIGLADQYQKFDDINHYGAHGLDANFIPRNSLSLNWQPVDYSEVHNDGAWICPQAYFEPDDSDVTLAPEDWNDQSILDWYNHNITPGFVARNIFFTFWYLANLLYGQVNNSGITGMTMTYDSISAKKSGSVAQNEESIKGFQYANLLKGSLLYDISIKNLQIHITKADGTDFESFKINTKSPVSIATIYSSGTDAAGPENTIGLSNKYFSNFDADAKVDIDRDIDRDKNLPMLVLGSLDEDKVMKPGNNIEVIINTEDTTPEFNGTWNAFPFLLDYNFWAVNHFNADDTEIVSPFPSLTADGGTDIYPA